MKHLWKILWLGASLLWLPFAVPVAAQAQSQMSNVKHVFVILMENHNWTGDNSAASAGDPDIKGSSLAPYINGLIPLGAHAEQYFNPAGNHPSLPNYLWLEAGTNFGVTADDAPNAAGQTTAQHLVTQLVNHTPAITWKAYAEPDFPNPDFTDCPQDFNELDVNHVPFAYFSDTTNGFNASSPNCIAHVVPYSHLAADLAAGTVAQYNFITPNLCHDGHEGISPCAPGENSDNTRRADDWLSIEVPKILNSAIYQTDGALFIVWDEAEDGGNFGDGPIGMFVLSPFAKRNYQNSIRYDHSSMLKTFQEIFGVTPLLGGAANTGTNDLSDFFLTAPPATLTSISVTPTTASIAAGATQAFTAAGTFSDGSTRDLSSTATWTSSNSAVATISKAGVATAVAAGTANIVAAQSGVSSNMAVLTVAAAPRLSSISVTPTSASIAAGATQAFTATGTFSDGSTRNLSSTATWTSSSSAVATMSTSGVATAVAAGTATIVAAQSGVSSNMAVLTVAAAPRLSSISVTPTSASIAAGATQAFTATGTFSDGSTRNLSSTATWTSSNAAVTTISTAGVATGMAAGTANIVAAQGGLTSNMAVVTVATPDFSLSDANGGSTSMLVTAGQTATFSLQVNPLGGFTGSVSLACSGAPTQATCTVSPASAEVNTASAAAFTVAVTTTARAVAVAAAMDNPLPPIPQQPAPMTALASAVALGGLTRVRRSKPVRLLGALGVLLACLSLLNACGAGGSSTAPALPGGTPAGTYTLTVTATSSGVSHAMNLTMTVS